MGGPRAKDNEGIIGSALCLSVYPGSSFHAQPPDPTVLEPGGLACNTAATLPLMHTGGAEGQAAASSTALRDSRMWWAAGQKTCWSNRRVGSSSSGLSILAEGCRKQLDPIMGKEGMGNSVLDA